MSTFPETIKAKLAEEVGRIQQGMICVIDTFDKETMRANVKPLMAEKPIGNSEPEALPILPNIPVGYIWDGNYYIRPDYQNGTTVWVTFATHDIDESLKGNIKQESERVFDLSSAMVVCGIAQTDQDMPAEFGSEDGLLIGHKDGNAYIKFESDKVTAIYGTKKVEFSDGGMRFFNGALWTNYMTHQHTETGAITSAPIAGT